jgi:hypothetical protein
MKMKLVFALCWRTPPALLKSLVQVGISTDLHTKTMSKFLDCRYNCSCLLTVLFMSSLFMFLHCQPYRTKRYGLSSASSSSCTTTRPRLCSRLPVASWPACACTAP